MADIESARQRTDSPRSVEMDIEEDSNRVTSRLSRPPSKHNLQAYSAPDDPYAVRKKCMPTFSGKRGRGNLSRLLLLAVLLLFALAVVITFVATGAATSGSL